eukprot:s204_g16.t4
MLLQILRNMSSAAPTRTIHRRAGSPSAATLNPKPLNPKPLHWIPAAGHDGLIRSSGGGRGRGAAMPPSGQNCGFAVQATKKGELPLKVEKRAKGKKVTIIGNVSGDATKLARGLQTMLGVGGSVRQVDRNAWSVEVQGDQVPRVTKALMDFQCLRGLSSSALETARTESESRRSDSVLDRTAATKFLTHTQSGGSMSPEEERRRLLEMEAEFYGQFWESAQSSEDFLDVFEESRDLPGSGDAEAPPRPKDVPELNLALQALGLLAECGRAIRDFWQSSGMTLQQFRKIALNPGARLVGDGPGRKQTPTNLKSRQKVSDWRSGGSKVSYFSPTVSAIDNYERGKSMLTKRLRLAYHLLEGQSKYHSDQHLARLLVVSALETRNGLPLRALSAMQPAQLPPYAPEDEDVIAGVTAARRISPMPEQTANAVPALAEDLIARMVGRMVPVCPDVLRATRAGDVFRGFGKALRGSKKLHRLSYQTKKINMFWSHSWHGSTWRKYMTLLLFYNGAAAAVIASLGSAVACVLFASELLPVLRGPNNFTEDLPYAHWQSFWAALVGMILYILMLLFWRPVDSIFFDMICIDQVSPERKGKGLVSMGAFLKASRSMLIL